MLLPGPGLTVAPLPPSEAALCPEPCLVPENAPPPARTHAHTHRVAPAPTSRPAAGPPATRCPKATLSARSSRGPSRRRRPLPWSRLSVSSLMKGKRNRQDFLRAAPRSSPSPVSALSPDVRRPGPPAFAAVPARARLLCPACPQTGFLAPHSCGHHPVIPASACCIPHASRSATGLGTPLYDVLCEVTVSKPANPRPWRL